MKALEFKSHIKDNKIVLPKRAQEFLQNFLNKEFRVIILVDELNDFDVKYDQVVQQNFFEGYVEEDSIYDDY